MKSQEYYWAPEDCLFESDGDCLDKFPQYGAAALVASHVVYDELKKKCKRLDLSNKMLEQAYELLKEQISPPGSRNYTFDLCETEGGSFQLCINLDALTPEEARKESDEIVAIWNMNTMGDT